MNAKHIPWPIMGLMILILLTACAAGGDAVQEQVEVTRVVTEEVQVEVTRVSEPESNLPTAVPTAPPQSTQAAPVPTPQPQATAVAAPTATAAVEATAVAPETTTNAPFTDTREDHLSTFAVDVDTGAYTLMRQYVQAGRLPSADTVRVEEYVNYFEQAYEPPTDTAFAIAADGAPSPFQNDDSQILRVGIQGYEIPVDQRQPVALTFVIDTSGSMKQVNRLGLLKQSLQLLVEQLGPDDTVSIVTYGSRARVELEPTNGRNQAAILDAIDGLRSGGSTNAEAGLVLGYQMANQGFRPEGTNRVILCSDGVANVGATSPDAILKRIQEEAEGGIMLTTIGVGMGSYNDHLMEQLADNGQGQYAYVDDLDAARQLFVTDLMGTMQTIALDAKVQVDFNPDVVTGYRLLGYENRDVADADFRNDTVDAGEIGAGHSVTALYAIQLAPESDGRIATVQLRWQDPDSYLVQEINHNINTWEMAPNFATAPNRYQLAVTVAQFAELLRRSPWANDTTFAELHDRAIQLADRLPDDPNVAEFANLIVWAAQASGAPIANAQILPVDWEAAMNKETASQLMASPTQTEPSVTQNDVISISSLARSMTSNRTLQYILDSVTAVLVIIIVIAAALWATVMTILIKRKYWKRQSFPSVNASNGILSPSQEAKVQVARARKYQQQAKTLVANHGKSAFADQLREMAAEFERWETHLEQLVKRLSNFESNALLQQDLEDVPKAILQVKAQIEAEENPDVRQQLEETFIGHREHQKQLESLTTLMRRTQLQINSTVTAMGTIYSQLQLLAAMDIDSGRAQRLSHEIEEEVLRLNDLLTAVDEVARHRNWQPICT